jgi:hypothetical protein
MAENLYLKNLEADNEIIHMILEYSAIGGGIFK